MKSISKKNTMKNRRLSIAGTILITIFFLFIFTTLGNTRSYGDAETEYVNVVVEPGDSLWSIAKIYTPDHSDIRKTIVIIIERNELENDIIYPGDFLLVPKIY